MRNLALAATLLLATIPAAEAQNRSAHRHYAPHHVHRYHAPPVRRHYAPPAYRHNNYWVAPLVGGLIIGGVATGLAVQSYNSCPYGTRLRYQDVYDQWGRYLGQRAACTDY